MVALKKSAAVVCSYCGVEGEELVDCLKCKRPVCWHPTCRGADNGECATCAGTLPETSVGNEDWTNGACPICEHKLEFDKVKYFSVADSDGFWATVKMNHYTCERGHITLTADYGNSALLGARSKKAELTPGMVVNFEPSAEADTLGQSLIAGPVTLLRRLTLDEADAMVGPMWLVRSATDVELSVFEDELSQAEVKS